ncbi:hypothetical protein BC834DRAFT_565017 [Gloeopeniophorella convolvens]|nr:hypothetical protein BC834DRAFT_565017 [Gloeopeniophorella convolvens]
MRATMASMPAPPILLQRVLTDSPTVTPPPCAQPRRIVSPKSPVIEQQASRKRDRSSTDASNRSLVTSPGRVPRPHKRQAKEDEFTRHGQDAPQLREDSPDGYIQSSENEIHGTSALLPTALHVGRSHRPNRKTPRSTHAPSTEPGGIDKSGTVPVKWKALS